MLAGQLGFCSSTSTSMHRAHLGISQAWGVGTLFQPVTKKNPENQQSKFATERKTLTWESSYADYYCVLGPGWLFILMLYLASSTVVRCFYLPPSHIVDCQIILLCQCYDDWPLEKFICALFVSFNLQSLYTKIFQYMKLSNIWI